MIVVDTSALVAILRNEPEADSIAACLTQAQECVIGAPTKFELLLVMSRPYGDQGLAIANNLLAQYGFSVHDWTSELADIAGRALVEFGKGRHPAALNFGDCMAYAVAKSRDAPLLFKGDDFSLTDVKIAV